MATKTFRTFLMAGSVCVIPPVAFAAPLPTYQVGIQPNGSVVSAYDQVLTPAGRQIGLGSPVRVTAVAVQPGGRIGAALIQGGNAPIQTFDLASGQVLSTFVPGTDKSGSIAGLLFSADGKRLYLSQNDGAVTVADVAADGVLSLNVRITLPLSTTNTYSNGTPNPCGMALSPDGTRLYVALNESNALGVIDLTRSTPSVTTVPVGSVPGSVVLSGGFAYVSNEGGRLPTPADFTVPSSGVNIVADPQSASSTTGTVSVVDLRTLAVVKTIVVGLHPTAMTADAGHVYVANTNSDTVSVIDTTTQSVARTLPVRPFPAAPFGSSPNSLAIVDGFLLATLGDNNAVAVLSLDPTDAASPVRGLIPTGAYPDSVAFDPARKQLVVGNNEGTGTLGPVYSFDGYVGHGPYADTGTVSLIPVPSIADVIRDTLAVYRNNHWNLANIINAFGDFPDPNAKPHAIPAHLGEPSLIKHVFLVVKENRTYDQILGDIGRGNSDPSLAEFGAFVTPNHHALATTFPLLDNFYDSGRQSGDGHQWIVQSIAPDYIERQVGAFTRSYPYNGGDSMAYSATGFLWQDALKAGKSVRVYGEYADQENYTFSGNVSTSWSDFYRNTLIIEGKATGDLTLPIGSVSQSTLIPSLNAVLDHNYPGFDLGIPDQFRIDAFKSEFDGFVKNGNLPNLIVMTIMCDHNTGTAATQPTPAAQTADNDLALGRLVDIVSHSPYWGSSAIFVEEDDAQAGVDHVDGHRSPAFVISPYAKHGAYVDDTYYTQVNINRTIEQILGLRPLNQFDLAAAPMSTAFTDQADLTPYAAVPEQIPLDLLNPGSSAMNTIQGAWQLASNAMFRGKLRTPDAEDENALNHVVWYATTGYSRPYPGEKTLLWPASFATLND